MSIKKRKNENFEKQTKNAFLSQSQGSFNPQIRFLGQKMCPVARGHTSHRQTRK